jgi:hypothetical protein
MKTWATLAVVAVLLLSACSGSQPENGPTLTESETPLGQLVLSAEGLGPLVIGQPPAADQDVLVHSPTVCQWEVDEGYRDDPSMWVANYLPALVGADSRPFGVEVTDGVLRVVQVYDDSIATDAGIHLGSTAAEVEAAYGDRLDLVEEYDEGSDSHLYRVAGEAGDLYIEVLKAETVDVHPEIGGELVLRLTASVKGEIPLGSNSDFLFGLCTQP